MKIGIDGYEANVTNRVGIGRYAYELLAHIYKEVKRGKNQGKRSDVSFVVFLPSVPLSDMPKATDWWQYRVVRPSRLWTFVGFPWAILREHPSLDVVFSPTHYIPRFVTIPRVMSVMDLSYLKFPGLFKKKDLYQLTRWTRYAVAHATRIFTISECTKNDIIDTYRVDGSAVEVTYPGFTMATGNVPTLDSLVKTYHIASKYILSVGTIQPRKNYAALIEAFSRVAHETEFAGTDLVIVGKPGWLVEGILAAPAKFSLEGRVHFLNFVPDSDLPAFYTHAQCFVLPSLYEGFGLPVLEAMAYKCPVVVSDVSSLPEIAGAAGIYVKPTDIESIAKGMRIVIGEKGTAEGKKRIEVGLKQVGKFTWEKAASQTLKILEEVGGKQ